VSDDDVNKYEDVDGPIPDLDLEEVFVDPGDCSVQLDSPCSMDL